MQAKHMGQQLECVLAGISTTYFASDDAPPRCHELASFLEACSRYIHRRVLIKVGHLSGLTVPPKNQIKFESSFSNKKTQKWPQGGHRKPYRYALCKMYLIKIFHIPNQGNAECKDYIPTLTFLRLFVNASLSHIIPESKLHILCCSCAQADYRDDATLSKSKRQFPVAPS